MSFSKREAFLWLRSLWTWTLLIDMSITLRYYEKFKVPKIVLPFLAHESLKGSESLRIEFLIWRSFLALYKGFLITLKFHKVSRQKFSPLSSGKQISRFNWVIVNKDDKKNVAETVTQAELRSRSQVWLQKPDLQIYPQFPSTFFKLNNYAKEFLSNNKRKEKDNLELMVEALGREMPRSISSLASNNAKAETRLLIRKHW